MTPRKPVIIHHFVDDSLITYDCGGETRDRWVARYSLAQLRRA